MKNFLLNALVKVFAIVFTLAMVVWCVAICIPLLIISELVLILFCNFDFENNEVGISKFEFAEKIFKWSMDFLVLPYKLLGVCDDFDGFVRWLCFNGI